MAQISPSPFSHHASTSTCHITKRHELLYPICKHLSNMLLMPAMVPFLSNAYSHSDLCFDMLSLISTSGYLGPDQTQLLSSKSVVGPVHLSPLPNRRRQRVECAAHGASAHRRRLQGVLPGGPAVAQAHGPHAQQGDHRDGRFRSEGGERVCVSWWFCSAEALKKKVQACIQAGTGVVHESQGVGFPWSMFGSGCCAGLEDSSGRGF